MFSIFISFHFYVVNFFVMLIFDNLYLFFYFFLDVLETSLSLIIRNFVMIILEGSIFFLNFFCLVLIVVWKVKKNEINVTR